MNEYTPKRGDRVRATLGKTTIYGMVGLVETKGLTVHPENTVIGLPMFYADGWTFERVWNIPTKQGALVRRKADNTLYTFVKREGRAAEFPWFNLTNGTFANLAPTWSDDKYVIEFGGVDQ